MVIICMGLQDNEGMNQRVQIEVDDPRRFSVHLAPIPQPPTQDNIVASQKSIFEDQDLSALTGCTDHLAVFLL
jgi:hypothetical protein